jgi:general secretion pathway protein I
MLRIPAKAVTQSRCQNWVPAFAKARSSAKERGFRPFDRSAEHGFTLLEMLVALAVFSLAALALVRLQGVTLRTAADLDSKALGQIVARNLMVEVQSDPVPPSIGQEDGDVENGGRRWHWSRSVKAMEDKRLLQVDLTVDGQPGASPVVLSFMRVVE